MTALASPVNTGNRKWVIRTGSNTDAFCVGTPTAPDDLPSGSSFTLHCSEYVSGAVPPGVATTLTLELHIDNTATVIRSMTPSGNTCSENPEDITIACTSTGVAGASARYGIVRLVIVAVSTAITNPYNGNSDTGGTNIEALTFSTGIYRCIPDLVAMSQSNAQTTYVPGDTIGTSFTADAASYDTTNNGNAWVTCGSVSYNLGSNFPTASAKSNTATIVGSLALWQDDCTAIKFGFEFTRNSAVTGFTTVKWAVWTGTPPSGVTFMGGNASLATSAILDRTASSSGCTTKVGATVITIANRGEAVKVRCTWKDARAVNVPSSSPVLGFYIRAGNLIGDTSDFASDSDSSLTSGESEFEISSTTATDTNSTGALDYRNEFRSFTTTARTDAVLLLIGNATGLFDITSKYNLAAIMNSLTSGSPANATQFIVGSSQHFMRVMNLQNGRGERLTISSGFLSCRRIQPDLVAESFIPMGSTDSQGTSGFIEYVPKAPTGNWTANCQLTTAHQGNTLDYSGYFLYISPLTSNQDIAIFAHLWNVSGSYFLNVTAAGVFWDPTTDSLQRAFADDPNVRLQPVVQNSSDGIVINWTTPPSTLMTVLSVVNGSYYANVSVPYGNFTAGDINVKMNMSGKTFIANRILTYTTLAAALYPCRVLSDPGVTCGGGGGSGGAGNFTGNFTGNVTFLDLNGMISFDLATPFYGNLTIAGVLVMLAWLAAFIWTASRHWYFLALISWLGILQPVYVSGFGVTFTALLVIWVVVLMFHVVLLWRDERKQPQRRADRS